MLIVQRQAPPKQRCKAYGYKRKQGDGSYIRQSGCKSNNKTPLERGAFYRKGEPCTKGWFFAATPMGSLIYVSEVDETTAFAYISNEQLSQWFVKLGHETCETIGIPVVTNFSEDVAATPAI